ncbi:unnamed protein product [Nyctereutes procyonoides]|uniref:(raccoon dog) hypothetical protein n=1 Tax=Nyctereutes procyonoides TaxID=34880 RepID=A0A811YG76_NYCPR|nr:unnamed protein product [Nyctereutes procyonoides]
MTKKINRKGLNCTLLLLIHWISGLFFLVYYFFSG